MRRSVRTQLDRGKHDDGFTLIELLVVIIIIGILAAIAIPTFLAQRQRAYEASMKSDLRNVANEETSYYTDSGTFADSSSVTITNPNGLSRGSVLIFPDAAVTLSAWNQITIPVAGGNGFCLKITSVKTSKTYYYDSLGGGITLTDCSGNSGY